MFGSELCPDIVSYNTVMKACGNADQVDLAFHLYGVMRGRGVEATVATFGTLISIAADAGRHDLVKTAWGWLGESGEYESNDNGLKFRMCVRPILL